MKRKLIVIVTALVLSAGVVVLYLALRPSEASEDVGTVTVHRGKLVELASATGTVEPHVQVEVKSRQSGEVIEVLVSEGDHVVPGQLLVRLDPVDAERAVREAKVALARARAELAQSRASLDVAEAESSEAVAKSDIRNRGAELGLVSTEDQRSAASSAKVATANITLRQAQLQSAQAAVETARLAVEESDRRLAEMEIKASIAGTVLAVDVERGSIVASGITAVSGGSTLMTIADLSDLRVVGDLDEAQVGRVQADQDVTIRVDAYPTRTFTGRVYRVSPLGEEESNIVTFDVEIMVTDPDANLLRSGMSADLEIVTARYDDVPLIPVTAIKGQGKRRFVELANGEQRPIKTGPTDGVKMVVLEGLSGGEEIVGPGGRSKGGGHGDRDHKRMMPFGPPPRGKR